jgi:hypothetical protein
MTRIKVIGFDVLPELYASNPYFSTIYNFAQAKGPLNILSMMVFSFAGLSFVFLIVLFRN